MGADAIEPPELYGSNHQSVVHIRQAYDDIVGQHLVFLLHRDLDSNKDGSGNSQRNEIKVYAGSPAALKGFENTAFEYHWKTAISSSSSS